jgi:cell division topological specificity factor
MSFLLRFQKRDRKSAIAASDRLQKLLIHDRTGISPGKIEALKEDLITVISKHFVIEPGGVTIELSRERDQHKLVADIPLASMRKRRK